MTNNPQPSALDPHRKWVPFVLVALMWVILALVVIPVWGWTYWDFGDGNYLYIARRVREGAVLYRDILAPQPPLHTLGGVLAQTIGQAVFGSSLYGVRAYCLLLRMAGSLLVLMLALKYFRCPFRGIVAAAIYLTMPIGFWWSLGYQSENLEIVFLTAALFLLIDWTPRRALLAGVCSALACHTNMTAVPYLFANLLFLAFRRPRLLAWYALPAAFVYTVIATGANIWTDGYFFRNVLFNQVGTFPRTDILQSNGGAPHSFPAYAWMKIRTQSWEVLVLESGFLAAAFLGAIHHLRRDPPIEEVVSGDRDRRHQTEFLAWQLIAGLCSICFTAKGGTVNYIFTLGEPIVAIFAASSFVLLFRFSYAQSAAVWRRTSLFDTRTVLLALFPLLIVGIVYAPAIDNIRKTMRQVQVELPERGSLELRGFIESYAEPGDLILAPPFFAYLTGTNVAAELAENYIWQIKWMNETFDAAHYGKPTGEGVARMEELSELLREQKIKVVLLDMEQTGRIPVIADAIAKYYQAAEPQPYRTRNTTLGLYVPNNIKLHHVPLGR